MNGNVFRTYIAEDLRKAHDRFDESFEDSDLNPALFRLYQSFNKLPLRLTGASDRVDNLFVYAGKIVKIDIDHDSFGDMLLGSAQSLPDPNPTQIYFEGVSKRSVEMALHEFSIFSDHYHAPSLVALVNPVKRERENFEKRFS